MSTKTVTNQASDAVCSRGWAEGADPEVYHRDETCWHGVAFRTAISMEFMMSEGVASSQPLRFWSTHFRMASNFLKESNECNVDYVMWILVH